MKSVPNMNFLWNFQAEGTHQPRLDNGGYYDVHAGLKVSPVRWDKVRGALFGLLINYDALLDYQTAVDPNRRENIQGLEGAFNLGYKTYDFGLFLGGRGVYLFDGWSVEGELAFSEQFRNLEWTSLRAFSVNLQYRYRAAHAGEAEAQHGSVAIRLIGRKYCSRISWRVGPSFEIDQDVAGRLGFGGMLVFGIGYLRSDYFCEPDTPSL